MREQFTIVDGHTHTYPTNDKAKKILNSFTTFYKMKPIHMGNGTIEEVVSNMQKGGIDYTILANFAPFQTLHQNNIWTIKMSKINNNFVPLVSIHPEMEGNIIKHLEQYIALGAKGIKIHSSVQKFLPNNFKFQSVYEFCNDIGFPIVFHCGITSEVSINNYSDLKMLMPVIDKYHNIPIILTHMAEGKVDDVLWISRMYKNVYFDTSIAITGLLCIKRVHDNCWLDDNVVIDVINKVGADRIMFGSDYPFGSPMHDVERILNMNITDEEKKMILGGNSIRIFSIRTE